jgi:hypothetical protein
MGTAAWTGLILSEATKLFTLIRKSTFVEFQPDTTHPLYLEEGRKERGISKKEGKG